MYSRITAITHKNPFPINCCWRFVGSVDMATIRAMWMLLSSWAFQVKSCARRRLMASSLPIPFPPSSVGSVDKYTRRVIAALCRRTNQHVKWPSESERSTIKYAVGLQSIFPHCIGFIDGTLIPLAYKPSVDGASDFFNRKHRYSTNVLVVCDPWKRFTYLRIGTVGSANDQAVVSSSEVRNLGSFLHPVGCQCMSCRPNHANHSLLCIAIPASRAFLRIRGVRAGRHRLRPR